jgi:hypothetical protein
MLVLLTQGAVMTNSRTLVATAALTFLIGVPAAQAQHRGGGGGEHSRGGGGGHSVSRSAPAARSGGGAQRAVAPRASASRGVTAAPRSYAAAPRSYAYGASRASGNGFRGGVVAGRSASRVIGSRGVRFAPARFFRPYYTFRPRLSLGFGLWAGFPIAYYNSYYDPFYDPYYYDPYANSYPYPAAGYPYPAAGYPAYPPSVDPSSTYPQAPYPPQTGSVGVQPGQDPRNMGGVSFEITPTTAQVFVDGSYVGTAGEFGATTQPLGLTPGRHQIEIRAPGYRTMSFDVDIVAGQVVPYQGKLQQ